jgi:hypothetical protein
MAIVVSILLAFAIQAWWEGRKDREFEADSLSRLSIEFTENRERLDRSRFESIARRAELLYRMVESLPTDGQAIQLPDSLLVLGVPTFDRVTPTLDGLIASSRLDLIQSMRVQEAGAGWERMLVQVQEIEESARAFEDLRLRPGLASRGDVSRVFADEDLAPGGATTLRFDTELKALIAERHARFQHVRRLRGSLRLATDRLLEAILNAEGD